MGTALSRISGCARDISMAICFGSAPELAAFMVAYRFANLFRRLLGEGNLSSGFIPHIASLPPEKGPLFFRDSVASMALVSLGFVCAVEIVLGSIAPLVSPDWAEIVRLTMYMVPGLVFACLYALNVAFLQFHQHYFLGGAAPALFNLLWIGLAFLGSFLPAQEAIRMLAMGVSSAFALQWALTAFQLRAHTSLSLKMWCRPRCFSPEWKKMLKSLTLGVLGVGALQINGALDAVFARFADLAGPAYLWYAIRIQQLPLALFGIALSGALLPPLSKAFAAGDLQLYRSLLSRAVQTTLLLFIPCSIALFVLAGDGVNLLYGHGDFGVDDVRKTTSCLWGYGIGLLPSVLTLLLASGFYAKKSYGPPTLASLLSVAFHILSNSVMVFFLKWGALSVALSTSLSAWINCLMLLGWMSFRFSVFPLALSFRLILQITLASTAGALFAQAAGSFTEEFSRAFLVQGLRLATMTGAFIGGFLAIAYALHIKEFFELFGKKTQTVAGPGL